MIGPGSLYSVRPFFMWLRKKTRINRPEQANCCALLEWVALNLKALPELELLHHIPNGGYRKPYEAMMLQGMGVKKGVLDYCLPVPRGRFAGMYLEMKADKGRLTPEQQWWREKLVEQHHHVAVCYNWQDAAEELTKYLKGMA